MTNGVEPEPTPSNDWYADYGWSDHETAVEYDENSRGNLLSQIGQISDAEAAYQRVMDLATAQNN